MRKFKVNEKKLNLTIQKPPSCLNSDYFCDYLWLIFSFLLALEVQNFTIFHDIFLNFNLLFYSLGIVSLIMFYQCVLVLLAVLCSALFRLWENRGKWHKLAVKNCYISVWTLVNEGSQSKTGYSGFTDAVMSMFIFDIFTWESQTLSIRITHCVLLRCDGTGVVDFSTLLLLV